MGQTTARVTNDAFTPNIKGVKNPLLRHIVESGCIVILINLLRVCGYSREPLDMCCLL